MAYFTMYFQSQKMKEEVFNLFFLLTITKILQVYFTYKKVLMHDENFAPDFHGKHCKPDIEECLPKNNIHIFIINLPQLYAIVMKISWGYSLQISVLGYE